MLQSQTKSTKNTIWRPIREIQFFKNVKRVHDACGDCPRPPQVFDRRPPATASAYVSSYKIPLEVEYQLVNDLAFIAAAYEGAKSVSAAAVSENAQSRGMTFTVASNAGVPKEVEAALREICHELQRCSCSESRRPVSSETLFAIVTKLHRQRILGRIESKYWTPPAHFSSRPREPFSEKFYESMGSHVGMRSTRNPELSAVLQASKDLQDIMDSLEGDQDLDGLKQVVKIASLLSGTHQSLAERLLNQNLTALAQMKVVKTVDKVGRYWACCQRMVKMASSRSYGYLFKSINLTTLSTYEPRIVLKRERHTHAEVQVMTYFRLRYTESKPRVIGTSKAACYLCNLFLSHHPQYLVSATHGGIFEPWTIPDLDAYSKTDRTELRGIIASMNRELMRQAMTRSRFPAPAQSGIFHPPPQFSASPASSRATLLSRLSDHTIHGPSVLDPLGRERFKAVINPQATRAGPYLQAGHLPVSEPSPHFESASHIASRLQTMTTHFPTSNYPPSPEPRSFSSQFSLSTPCPSPRIPHGLRRARGQFEEYEADTAPGITSPPFDLRLENLTPERQDWLDVFGMRLVFELESVESGKRGYSRQKPMGTAFIRRISKTEIPLGLNVINVQSMIPGIDITLEKAETAGSLDFVLLNGRRGATHVVCQWNSPGS